MIIRQGLNFAAHLAAGIAFGALAVVAVTACAKCRGRSMNTHSGSLSDDAGTWERPSASPG